MTLFWHLLTQMLPGNFTTASSCHGEAADVNGMIETLQIHNSDINRSVQPALNPLIPTVGDAQSHYVKRASKRLHNERVNLR